MEKIIKILLFPTIRIKFEKHKNEESHKYKTRENGTFL